MLRAVIIGAAAVAAAVFLVLGLAVHPYFLVEALGAVVVLVAALFEARRYRSRVSGTAGWQDTDEKFVDPTTGRLMKVRFNPRTGERDYVEAGPES